MKELIGKLRSFLLSPTYSRTFALIGFLVLVIALPVTVIVLQQRTQTQQNAYQACTPDSHYQCGGSGCPKSFPSTHRVFVNETDRCTTICTDQGETSGCGGCKPTQSRVCNPYGTDPYLWCQADGNTCTMHVAYSDCKHQEGACGYTAPPKPNQAACDNYVDSHPYDFTKGSGDCIPAKDCQLAMNEDKDYTDASSTVCQNGSVCCAKISKPVTCETGTFPSESGNPGPNTGKCIDLNTQTCTEASTARVTTNCGGSENPGLKYCCKASKVTARTITCDHPNESAPNNTYKDSSAGSKSCASDEMCTTTITNGSPCVKGPQITITQNLTHCGKNLTGICVYDYVSKVGYTTDRLKACANTCPDIPGCSTISAGNWSDDLTARAGECGDLLGNPFRCCQPTKPSTAPTAPPASDECKAAHGYCSSIGPGCQVDHMSYHFVGVPNYSCPNPSGAQAGGGCCVPNTACGAEGQTCCVLGDKCDSGLTCNSSNKCAKTNGSGCGNNCPTPTPSCTNGKTTGFVLSLKLEGIGAGTLENNSPARPVRTAGYVTVTSEAGTTLYNSTTTQFTYSNGRFTAPSVALGTALSCGHTYTVTVKLPGYVKASSTLAYASNGTININPIQGDLVANDNNNHLTAAGEILGDDKVDVLDYNIVKTCRNVSPDTVIPFTNNTQTINIKCRNFMNLFDYADGGTQGDAWSFNYNLWARGLVKANP